MMLCPSLRRLASSVSGGFSSAAFTGDDGGAYERLRSEQEWLAREHQREGADAQERQQRRHGCGEGSRHTGATATASTSPSSSSEETCAPTGFHGVRNGGGRYGGSAGTAADAALDRPTIDTYRAMTDSELAETLRTREGQARQLRAIYENFHYDADRHFRKMIFDYHDKTMQLSQVHGRMQQTSLQINREALTKMRDEQDMMTRDKRIIFTLCTLWTLVFWVWVRRHYVERRELEREPLDAQEWAQMSPSITGAGSYNDNVFGSNRRNARFRETAWEREVRERREAQDLQERQHTLQKKQVELQRAVVAQREQGQEK